MGYPRIAGQIILTRPFRLEETDRCIQACDNNRLHAALESR
jgi:hypothetical protein